MRPKNRTATGQQTGQQPDTAKEGKERKKGRREEGKKEPLPTVEVVRVPVILPFASEAFAEAWRLWENSRKEKGQPIKPTARKLQLAKCVQWGEQRAIAALENSASNGYTGLYEPSTQTGHGKPRQGTLQQSFDNIDRLINERYESSQQASVGTDNGPHGAWSHPKQAGEGGG